MKNLTLIILLALVSVFNLQAEDILYKTTDYQYTIKGSTKIPYLERRLGIDRNKTFNSITEIDSYVESITQSLQNLRIYENLNVSYTLDNNNISFFIVLDEAFGLIPFPYPKFNSETGGRIATKLYWYNSLGSLANTLFTGGINFGMDDGDTSLKILTWDVSATVENLLLFNRYFNLSISQQLARSSKDNYLWNYDTTTLGLTTSFNPFSDFSYTHSITLSGNYNYKPLNNFTTNSIIQAYKNPLSLNYNQTLGRGSINWIGNFRDGFNYSIGNSLSLSYTDNSTLSPNATLSLNGAYFKAQRGFPIAFGTKLYGVISLNSELLGLGINLRGIQSGDIYGRMGFFSINNIYIRVIKIPNIAEAIFGPHLDFGITDNLNPKIGTGADFILYVDKLKSMVARGSLSIDLTNFNPDTFSLENIEIDITSSLFF